MSTEKCILVVGMWMGRLRLVKVMALFIIKFSTSWILWKFHTEQIRFSLLWNLRNNPKTHVAFSQRQPIIVCPAIRPLIWSCKVINSRGQPRLCEIKGTRRDDNKTSQEVGGLVKARCDQEVRHFMWQSDLGHAAVDTVDFDRDWIPCFNCSPDRFY